MGDKGGKKDKEKGQKQNAEKQKKRQKEIWISNLYRSLDGKPLSRHEKYKPQT